MPGPDGEAVQVYVVPVTGEEKVTAVVEVPEHIDWLARLRFTVGIGFTVTI
jgi:hypothetical protein